MFTSKTREKPTNQSSQCDAICDGSCPILNVLGKTHPAPIEAGELPDCGRALPALSIRMHAAPLFTATRIKGFALVGVLLCAPLLNSCQSMSHATQETTYSAMTRKKEDRLERVSNPAGFTFLVTCPSGIGGATATLHGGQWPSEFRVRLRYAEGRPFTRLEGFTVASGKRKPVEIRSAQFGPEWAEVTVPPEVLRSAGDVLVLEWVDAHRR